LPHIAAMRRLAVRFRGILQSKDTQRLEIWLDDAQQSGIYAVQRFASTLRPHLTAVNYALTETLEEWPDQKTKSTG
jgi:transposase